MNYFIITKSMGSFSRRLHRFSRRCAQMGSIIRLCENPRNLRGIQSAASAGNTYRNPFIFPIA